MALGGRLLGRGGLSRDPSLVLWHPFDLSKSLEAYIGPTLDIVRATDATYFDAAGVLQTAASGVARFDHSPTSPFASLGLLVEEERTNLVTRSFEYDHADWTIRGTASITANDDTAPDGTLTADLLEGLDIGANDIFQVQTVTDDVVYTPTIWIKRVSATGTFNILNAGDAARGELTVDLALIGSDWVRIRAGITGVVEDVEATGSTSNQGGIHLRGITGTPLSMHLWVSQVELGGFPTSTIPTVASTVTRNADAVSTTDVSWYSQGAGTTYAKGSRADDSVSGVPYLWQLSDNSNSDRISIASNSSGRISFLLRAVDVNGANGNSPNDSWPENTIDEMAAAWGATSGNAAVYIDGVSVSITGDTVNPPTNITDLNVGQQWNETNQINGHIAELRYYNVRKDNQFLKNLSNGVIPA